LDSSGHAQLLFFAGVRRRLELLAFAGCFRAELVLLVAFLAPEPLELAALAAGRRLDVAALAAGRRLEPLEPLLAAVLRGFRAEPRFSSCAALELLLETTSPSRISPSHPSTSSG
jgi:hypothetical protein